MAKREIRKGNSGADSSVQDAIVAEQMTEPPAERKTVRFTMAMTPSRHADLMRLSRYHGIPAAEIIDLLLDGYMKAQADNIEKQRKIDGQAKSNVMLGMPGRP